MRLSALFLSASFFLLTACMGERPEPGEPKPSFELEIEEPVAEPPADRIEITMTPADDVGYRLRIDIRDCRRHAEWVQMLMSAPYLTDGHREQLKQGDDEKLVRVQAMHDSDGSPKWVAERERRIQFFMEMEEMRYLVLADDADLEILQASLDQCEAMTDKVQEYLFPPAPDQLWDTAPEFVRDQAQAFHDRYWTPSAFAAAMAWGTCQVPGVDDGCSWFCWTNTDSLQQCSFSVMIPEAVQRKFNRLGKIEIEQLPNGQIREDRACYSHSDEESGSTYLAVYHGCLGDSSNWPDNHCSANYQVCDREAATNALIVAINQGGAWEMEIEQHLISDRPLPTQ